jgi:hypothetical protein
MRLRECRQSTVEDQTNFETATVQIGACHNADADLGFAHEPIPRHRPHQNSA